MPVPPSPLEATLQEPCRLQEADYSLQEQTKHILGCISKALRGNGESMAIIRQPGYLRRHRGSTAAAGCMSIPAPLCLLCPSAEGGMTWVHLKKQGKHLGRGRDSVFWTVPVYRQELGSPGAKFPRQLDSPCATKRDELDQGSGRREEPRGCTNRDKTHVPCCHDHPTGLCSTKPLRKGPNPGSRATALPRELYLLWKCLLELYKNNLRIGLPHA